MHGGDQSKGDLIAPHGAEGRMSATAGAPDCEGTRRQRPFAIQLCHKDCWREGTSDGRKGAKQGP